MSLRDDDELALPDDLLAVEALLVAIRDVERTPDMAARARALGEADEVQAIGTPVESAIGTRVEAPAATTAVKPRSGALEAEKSTPRPGRASARRSGASGEVGRLRSKVALLQLAGVLGGVVLLIGGWQWARLAAAPAPPPPKVIDHVATLKTAQQRAKDGYRKASEGRLAKDRAEAGRLFREAIGDLDAALAIYEDLFEKYPGEKYEYLGPEVDRLNQTKMQLRKELAAYPQPARLPPPTQPAAVDATLTNLPDGARFDVRGSLGQHLPDGAVVSVSLRVRDVVPVVELAFFQAEVRGGSYSGSRQWTTGPTLAPMGYQTVVTLSMQSQSPVVRKLLAREAGYGAETTLTLGTDDDDVGTREEQVRFAAATRQELLAHVEAALRLHTQLGQRLEGPMDDAWAVWSLSHDQDVRAARESLGELKARHVVSPEGSAMEALEEAFATMVRSARARALREGDPRPDFTAAGDELRRLRAELAPPGER